VVGDIIGEGASEERAVVGETPNLAARLQSLAEPDTMVISDRTRRLVGRSFSVTDLGLNPIKGFDEPVQAWRVERERRSGGSSSGHGPLVGRASELALLAERWKSAQAGEGRAVSIVAEAGYGKSHLVARALEDLAVDPQVVRRYVCARHARGTPLRPVLEWLTEAAGLELADAVDERRRKIDAWAARAGLDVDSDATILASVMGVGSTEAPELGPDAMRAATLASLSKELGGAVSRHPCVIVFEDVHWADAVTMQWIKQTVDAAARCALLVVITHRPDLDLTWSTSDHVTSVSLGKLAPECGREIVTRLAAAAEASNLGTEVIDAIVSRADGVPAFITELARAVLASADAQHGSVVVPESLQDSLAAQLDRLDPVTREVAQLAAVIGREFSVELLRRVFAGGVETMRSALDRLVEVGLVHPPGLAPGARHVFRHGLLRDVAYQRLLRRRRRELHDRIATVWLAELPAEAQAVPENLAWHLDAAGRHHEAAPFWDGAGKHAAQRGVPADAAVHFARAVRSYEAGPHAETPEVESSIVVIRTAMASNMRLYGKIDEAFSQLDRAEPVARRLDDPALLSDLHFTRGNLHFRRGQLEACMSSHRLALTEAQRARSVRAEAQAYGGLADAHLVAYRIPEGLEYYRRCIELAEEHGFLQMAAAHLAPLGFSEYWSLRLEEAWASGLRGAELSQSIGDLRSRGNTYYLMCVLAWTRHDFDEMDRWTERLREVASIESQLLIGTCGAYEARVLIARGEVERARDILERLLDELDEPRVYAQAGGAWLTIGDGPRYQRVLDHFVEKVSADPMDFFSAMFAKSGLLALVARGDVPAVRGLLDALPHMAGAEDRAPEIAFIVQAARAWETWAGSRSDTAREILDAALVRADAVGHRALENALATGIAEVEAARSEST
jgi:tetratricopeptide (TPR) repeat protein